MGRKKIDGGKEYFTAITTKIPCSDKERLCKIAECFGMSLYNIMQSLVLLICRMADKGSVITYEHNIMLKAFWDIANQTKDSFSPMAIRGHEQQRVCSAILFMQRKPDQRPQLMEVHKSEHGVMMESYNNDTMLSAFLNCLDPNGLQRLEDEAKRLGYSSITQTLHELIMNHTTPRPDAMSDEVREMFSDIRVVSGEQINEDIHYKQKHNRGDYTTITPPKRTLRADK